MRFVLLPLVDEARWDALLPDERQREIVAFAAFGAALREADGLVGNYRPQPSAAAKTVRVAAGVPQVADGPHAATREQLGGIYIIDVPDLDAALAWAARVPVVRYGLVEVRPLWGGQP